MPPDTPTVAIAIPSSGDLYKGNTVKLNIVYSNASLFTGNIWFQSSDWGVAGVQNDGTVTFNNAGTAEITAFAITNDNQTIKSEPIRLTVTDNPPTPGFMLGDVTMDGIITGSDATITLRAYTLISSGMDHGLTDMQFKAADVDGNGIITGSDATFLLRYYTELSSLLKGETLPPMEEWIKK